MWNLGESDATLPQEMDNYYTNYIPEQKMACIPDLKRNY
jgi:hypothetical protein